MSPIDPMRDVHPERSPTHPCVWILPRGSGSGWPCRIEREPGGTHEDLPSISTLTELTTRAAAHRASRIVVCDRVYAELVAAGAAPGLRPAGIAAYDPPASAAGDA